MSCNIKKDNTKSLHMHMGDKYYIKFMIGDRRGTFSLCNKFLMHLSSTDSEHEIYGENLDPGTSIVSFFVDSSTLGSGNYEYRIIGEGKVNGKHSQYTFLKNGILSIS